MKDERGVGSIGVPRNDESFLLKYFFDAVEYRMG